MAKAIAKKAVTVEQYREALQAYKTNEIAARAKAAEQDKKVAKIQDAYRPFFEEYMAEQKEREAVIKEYCENNREELFGSKQSTTENGVTLAFRKGTISVAVLEGCTEETALELVKVNLPDYVKVVESLDKRKMVTDRETINDDLEECGLYFAQGEETFTIKPIETKVK